MSLDFSKLQNIRRQDRATIARCPACAEDGHDRKGNHLFIAADGRFGCILYPGDAGRQHRRKIFELAGAVEQPFGTLGTATTAFNQIKKQQSIELPGIQKSKESKAKCHT